MVYSGLITVNCGNRVADIKSLCEKFESFKVSAGFT
jgi:hypothetical protein